MRLPRKVRNMSILRCAAAILAGGTLAFVWSCASWLTIPWHQSSMSIFENEESVAALVRTAAPHPGVYTYPGWTTDEEAMQAKHERGPYVFASIVPAGVGSEIGTTMATGFALSVLGAAGLFGLMTLSGHDSRRRRLGLALAASLFIALMPALMHWNWWHFPLGFTFVGVFDEVIAWSLASTALVAIAPAPRRDAREVAP